MTVFKAFLSILNKCKGIVILYSVILISFGAFNFKTSDQNISYEDSKPDILIVNHDLESELTKNLISYLEFHANIVEIEDSDEARSDALFYRDVNMIIEIPEAYSHDFINKLKPQLIIEKTGDYNSSYAEMLLNKYLKVANVYVQTGYKGEELLEKINHTLKDEVNVEITTKIDTDNLSNATFYYNFLSYSMLAGAIYVICLIISSFKKDGVYKRMIISKTSIEKINRILLLSNMLFAILLWLIYVIVSIILVGNIMFTSYGLIYLLNSFIFTMCTVTIAFLISNLVNDKNAINGIVNVVALGSSFLCGAFVPMEWLPSSVLNIAHILPTYWYILSNEKLKTLEVINFTTLKPIIFNMGVIIMISIIFIILTNLVSKRKQKIG